MKRCYPLLLMVVLALLGSVFSADPPLAENHLFREVKVSADAWEVVFHEQGVRFTVKVNRADQGVSNYGQRLMLKRGDVLRLAEKHSSVTIEAAEVDGKLGIKRMSQFRDFKTGERRVETVFEPVHGVVN